MLALLLVTGCSEALDTPEDEALGPPTAELLDEGKFDRVAGELRVRAGNMTVWLDTSLTPQGADGTWALHGRTSRNLAAVFSWVPDDAFGRAEVVGPRRFRIALDGHEANSLLSGLPLYVSLTPVGRESSTHTARVLLEPGFGSFEGSRRVFVEQALRPIWLDGDVAYRTHVLLDDGLGMLGVETADGGMLSLVEVAPRRHRLDVSFEWLRQVGPSRVGFVAALDDGELLVKRATLRWAVAGLAVTTEDPYAVWPPAACLAPVRTCLDGLPGARRDTGDCGSYREVLACGGPFAPEPVEEPAGDWDSCHPRLLEGIRACIDDQMADPDAGELLIEDVVVACTDAEPMADDYDGICTEVRPAPAYCSASYEAFWTALGPICADAIRLELGLE